jgi:mono/diheme cytochrome c family protein
MPLRSTRTEFRKLRFFTGAASLFLLVDIAHADDRAANLFREQIQPVLAKSCLGCHSAQAKQGGLDLSSRDAVLRGGDHGPAIVPGNAGESLLYKLIARQQEPAMPYKSGPIAKEAVDKFADWINLGASYGESVHEPLFTEVRPLLETKCLACHGGGKTNRSGFDLATRDGLLRGGDNGPAVVPGKAQESALLKRIRHEVSPGMPYQGQKLADSEIAKIADWVNAGARYDAPLKMAEAARPVSNHWAFQIPKKPPVPVVKERQWVRNPIDAFVAAEREKKGLKPLPPAEKNVLLRRVYLDLIGLPPTTAQVRGFVADRSRDAYEKVVDTLLSSPQYGERWGRHWMDIWRYSDWYGRRDGDDQRNSARNIWHWRDWIIESLNQDKGYNRMIVEMLAADELDAKDPNALRATGYLARDFYRFNRNVWMQDAVEHTAAGFLGITMKCARCHDHKYDPISQEEYYRFRAFFEPYDVRVDRLEGQPDPNKDGIARAFDNEPREGTSEAPFITAIYANTYRLVRGDENSPDKSKPLDPGVPEVLSQREPQIKPVSLPVEAYNPDIRPFVGQDLIAQAKTEIGKAEKRVDSVKLELARAQQRITASPVENAPDVSFEKEIKPIFEQHCMMCHNPKNDKSGLSLETPESIILGGSKQGSAVKFGKSEESPLILYLRGKKQPRMPLGGPALPDAQIVLVAKWIDQLQEDPHLALKKAEDQAALAEKELAWRRADLPAVEARIAADHAKYASPPDPNAEKSAEVAQKVERGANVLKAETELLRAQQQLAEAQRTSGPEKVKEKKVAAARKAAQEAAAALGQATDGYTPIAKPYPKTSTGRRTALAYWIASKQNPLTARVAVNDMWLRHFGKALVPTVVNFGQNGKPPTHPALLDWLAVQFMDSGWSMKAMHRLMVTSNTYRMQSSDPDAKDPNLAIDVENRYYWRMNPRRVEAEIVRDSILYLAGQLDMSMSGPDIDEEKADDVHRRSLYFRHTPDSQVQILKLFDQPDPTDCYVRTESIVPQQALALSNSRLSFSAARALARRISEKLGGKATDADFIGNAFETVLDQAPSAEELAASEKFLREQTELLADTTKLNKFKSGSSPEIAASADPHSRARENLVHALFNHTEFVTIR